MTQDLHLGMHQALHDVLTRALLAAGAAFVLTIVLTVLIRPLATFMGLLARPGGHRTHSLPTPVVGGMAILLAIIPIGLFLMPLTAPIRSLGLAAVLILAAGIVDDLFDLRWYYRFCVQVAAALIVIYVGGVRVEEIGPVFGLQAHTLGVFSPLFTVVATVGLINAINFADGIDGLAGFLTLTAMAMLASAAIYAGNTRVADGLVLMFGAVSAFLLFNLRTPWNPRAQVFLGNSGAELLGLIIAFASFRLTQNVNHPVAPVLAPFLIAPPVIDCLVLAARRLRRGVSPFHADRNHMHHLMQDAGYSATATTVVISAASMFIGLCAALAMRAHIAPPWFLATFLGLTIGYYLFTGRRDRAVAWLRRPRALSALGKASSQGARQSPPAVEAIRLEAAPAPEIANRPLSKVARRSGSEVPAQPENAVKAKAISLKTRHREPAPPSAATRVSVQSDLEPKASN
jgi:UDP-GlcNAc:undecaprenyl-phosphate/decaprenyl-phosphate GlcNAc-1-phosphate transferase